MVFSSKKNNPQIPDLQELRIRMENEIRDHRVWYVSQGILFIIFGILAAALPAVIAISIELLIGIILIISGISQILIAHRSNMHWWVALSALLSIFIGGMMLWKPFAGLFAIIFLIGTFLIIEGIFELLLAAQFYPLGNWGWMMVSGIVAIMLSVFIFTSFPTLGIFYIGFMVAINLILYGVSLLMLVYNIG